MECWAHSISTAPAGSVTRTSPPSRASCIAGIGAFSWYRAITRPPIRGAGYLHFIPNIVPNRRPLCVEITDCRPCLCSGSQSNKSVEAMKRLRRAVSFFEAVPSPPISDSYLHGPVHTSLGVGLGFHDDEFLAALKRSNVPTMTQASSPLARLTTTLHRRFGDMGDAASQGAAGCYPFCIRTIRSDRRCRPRVRIAGFTGMTPTRRSLCGAILYTDRSRA